MPILVSVSDGITTCQLSTFASGLTRTLLNFAKKSSSEQSEKSGDDFGVRIS
jgi:hypothetical protein